MTIICSADPGSRNFGSSVCEISRDKKELLFTTSWYLDPPKLGDRMVFLEKELSKLIKEYKVEHLCYEKPYLKAGKNLHSIYACTSVMELLSGIHNLPISSVTASQMKKLVVGNGAGKGKEGKLAVEKGVREFFNLPETFFFLSDHSSDSAGVGIAGYKTSLC